MASMSFTALLQELRERENQAFRLREMSFQATTEAATAFYEETYEWEMQRITWLNEEIEHIKEDRVAKRARTEE